MGNEAEREEVRGEATGRGMAGWAGCGAELSDRELELLAAGKRDDASMVGDAKLFGGRKGQKGKKK
jgi:hypothetical protein